MKKLFSVLLLITMIAAAASAESWTVTSLADLQKLIENNTPADLLGPETFNVCLSGTILEIHSCNKNNHYEMTLQVRDDGALPPIGYDDPILTVHFRLHVDPIPFSVGDEIEVTGELNSLYSSVMVPFIQAATINGSDEF